MSEIKREFQLNQTQIFKLILFLTLLSLFNSSYALEMHTKAWINSVFTGPLSNDKKVKFYLEPDLRLIDDKYKFQSALLWMGLGYQFKPDFSLYMGDAVTTSRKLNGAYYHTNIVWQQANWMFYDSPNYRLDSRSRFEEAKRNNDPQWLVEFRERIQITFPLKNWQYHSLVLSDEVFFSLKHPHWLKNNNFMSQNRAYAGIKTQLSKETAFSIGYLNQYQLTFTHQLSNVLFFSFDVNFG